MAHTVDYLPSAHYLWSVYGQQRGQAERKKDPVGSNFAGDQRQPATGQIGVPAVWQWTPHFRTRHEVLLQ